jgi:ADP-ribosylglycohydrolase
MKTACTILFILFYFSGCNLFKKTSSNSSANTEASTKQTASSQLVLRSANKETQVFTYWNDSSIYQYQLITEQVNEAQSDKLKTEEEQQAKQQQTIKESEPANAWIYMGIAIAVIGCCIIIYTIRLN